MLSSTGVLDGALLFGGALVAGQIAWVAPFEVALVLAAFVLVARGRLVVCAIACAGLALGFVRAARAVDAHEGARAAAVAALGRGGRCEARAIVASSPVRLGGSMRWDARLSAIVCDEVAIAWRGRGTVYGGPPDLARGDEVEIIGTIAPTQRLWNEAQGDPRPGEAARGVIVSGGAIDVRVRRRATGPPAWVDRFRAHVRDRIDATFTAQAAPMARALVLGETDLPRADQQDFRASGLSHLLAVSGMHLVLVVLGIARALGAIFVRVSSLASRVDAGRISACAAIPLAWAYADFAGGSGSSVRAAWMLSAILAARAFGRRSDPARALGLSLAAGALVDPLAAFDLSLLLSAAATAGLVLAGEPLARRLARVLPEKLAKPMATSLAASAACTPIVARFAPQLALGGVVANLIAVPIGEMAALPLCLVHAVLSPWPRAESGCARVASGALAVVRAMAGWSARLAVEVPVPTSWQLAVIASAALVLLLPRARGRASALAVCAAAFLLLEIGARRAGAPHAELRATFLDVGQGDAAIVDLPDGDAMMIDGGGLVGSPVDVGERVLAPVLRARRRSAIRAVVLTHPHPDHYGGLHAVLAAARVAELWDTGEGEARGTDAAVLALLAEARARGIPVLRPDALCGARAIGGARVEVLAPCPGPQRARGANDNSLVLRISYGRRALLFTGDAERAAEDELLARAPGRLAADLLKVGHHGSRTSSSPAFVAAVHPREAVVSCGIRNRFGHPAPSTLETLGAAGARVWRTDRDGAVIAVTDGASLSVRVIGRSPVPPGAPPW